MNIAAVILAAGRSARMGRQKLLLPWGDTTVLGRVIDVVCSAGVEDILVVANKETGGAFVHSARIVHNEEGGMLRSMQLGVQAQSDSAEAVLICLGDQPQIEERSVRLVCEAYLKNKSPIVAPSHQMRRGHPWLLARSLWGEFLSLSPSSTPREFLKKHEAMIEHVEAGTATILQDVDTPEDYLKFKPAV